MCYRIKSKSKVILNGNKFKIEKISRVAAVTEITVDQLYLFLDSKIAIPQTSD